MGDLSGCLLDRVRALDFCAKSEGFPVISKVLFISKVLSGFVWYFNAMDGRRGPVFLV
jgi:hypothetical protein